jgi:hypothetical protein
MALGTTREFSLVDTRLPDEVDNENLLEFDITCQVILGRRGWGWISLLATTLYHWSQLVGET